jgi:hypothetical protein
MSLLVVTYGARPGRHPLTEGISPADDGRSGDRVHHHRIAVVGQVAAVMLCPADPLVAWPLIAQAWAFLRERADRRPA